MHASDTYNSILHVVMQTAANSASHDHWYLSRRDKGHSDPMNKINVTLSHANLQRWHSMKTKQSIILMLCDIDAVTFMPRDDIHACISWIHVANYYYNH